MLFLIGVRLVLLLRHGHVQANADILHRSKEWHTVGREVAWHHPMKEMHDFADLLVANRYNARLVIECKQLAEHGAYVFLVPNRAVLPQYDR